MLNVTVIHVAFRNVSIAVPAQAADNLISNGAGPLAAADYM